MGALKPAAARPPPGLRGLTAPIGRNRSLPCLECKKRPFALRYSSGRPSIPSSRLETGASLLDICLRNQRSPAKAQAPATQATIPVGVVLPWLSKSPPPPGLVLCDGSDARCPNLTGRFLRGGALADVGNTGGSENSTRHIPQHGSNNRTPDGNGWSLDGSHYRSNDDVTIDVEPAFMSVRFIMKVH